MTEGLLKSTERACGDASACLPSSTVLIASRAHGRGILPDDSLSKRLVDSIDTCQPAWSFSGPCEAVVCWSSCGECRDGSFEPHDRCHKVVEMGRLQVQRRKLVSLLSSAGQQSWSAGDLGARSWCRCVRDAVVTATGHQQWLKCCRMCWFCLSRHLELSEDSGEGRASGS